MWLLEETNKFFAKCCTFNLCTFWGNFNPRNTGWGIFFFSLFAGLLGAVDWILYSIVYVQPRCYRV